METTIKKITFREYLRFCMSIFLSFWIVLSLILWVSYFAIFIINKYNVTKIEYYKILVKYIQIWVESINYIILHTNIYVKLWAIFGGVLLLWLIFGTLTYYINNLFLKILKIKIIEIPTRKEELDEFFDKK